ncbi:nucleotide-binding protein [Ferruginibacter sp.]|nr:nucleotide-binding protein [Ferruginibacter sp.]
MKPKLFIGSSSEALEVANAIQENLNYDAEVTVWNQGIFKLSSTSLTDLIAAVSKSDFAIFVFNPDDISIIREQNYATVRDNIIFELGLFIGKLGQNNVFYVIPEKETMHLPTDLLGVNPGVYNSKRTDKNLLAALGPFCNQVRIHLKEFRYVNLQDLHNESEEVKKIAIEQPFGYEYLILAELIEARLDKANIMQKNLRNGVYFVRSVHCTDEDYYRFFQDTLEDFQRFIKIFSHLILEKMEGALGPKGVPSKFLDLKNFSDELSNLSIELFNWETRNEQLRPDDELSQVKDLLRGTSDVLTSQINRLPNEIRKIVKANQDPNAKQEDKKIDITLELPPQVEQALAVFQNYYRRKGLL